MREKISGFVLNIRKYNDRQSILTIYSRQRGRLSLISASGTGKASNARRARLQPLSLIETEITFKPGAELQRLGPVATPIVWSDIYFHPLKRVMALFISEFLYKLLSESAPDENLFDFLVSSFSLLDNLKKGIADFHIPFLVSLLTFSGIQPDVSNFASGNVFEFASGSFVPEFEAHGPTLAGEEAKAVTWIIRINFHNMKCLRLTGANRRQILYVLLNYYSYHFPGLGSLKSPEVLKAVFE